MKSAPRLYIEDDLLPAREFALPREQGHYLANVLRLKPGDSVSLFNERDGEWRAFLRDVSRKQVTVYVERDVCAAKPPPDIELLFAPLKHARLDYMIQKAVELGVRRLRPVITARTIVDRVNLQRMKANAIEAAEQCNLVFVPEVVEPQKLEAVLADWERERTIVYADEAAPMASPLAALEPLGLPAAALIGPEGGFTDMERDGLRGLSFVKPLSLGPRIIRADTAMAALLSLMQATLGDWR
jgi:16S rRNA (uracil1498-N3)-methyltransferase